MRFSSHRSSSTFKTGMLEAARVKPVFRRRVASSRPRRCGIETTRGALIFGSSSDVTACISSFVGKKRAADQRWRSDGTFRIPICFSYEGRATGADCRAGGELHVDWNDYSYYS